MIEDGRDYKIYISYSLLNFPKIINKIFPFVLFFSLFHVTIKYENNNELLIFWTFGITKIELTNLILKFSLILMLIQIFLSSIIIPISQDIARSFLRTSTVNFFGNFIKPQRFNDTIKNVTLYSEKKDAEGNLINLYLKKQLDENNFQITYAKKGIFKKYNNTSTLILYNGETITGKNDEITNFSFSKSDFPLNNFETNTTTYKKTQELTSLNLIQCVKLLHSKTQIKSSTIQNCSKKNLRNIYKELYKRFIIPLYIPLLSFVPFLLTLTSKENLNYSRIKIITFMIGLLVIIFSETSIRMISEIVLKNLLFTILPFLFLSIFYFIYFNKTNFKLTIK
jgi:lipopolysaccharide export system permease protein